MWSSLRIRKGLCLNISLEINLTKSASVPHDSKHVHDCRFLSISESRHANKTMCGIISGNN